MRKQKIVSVPEALVLEVVIRFSTSGPNYINVCRFDDKIPKDVRVISVHSNYMTGTFDFIIEHESFDEVSDVEMLPRIQTTLTEHVYEVKL